MKLLIGLHRHCWASVSSSKRDHYPSQVFIFFLSIFYALRLHNSARSSIGLRAIQPGEIYGKSAHDERASKMSRPDSSSTHAHSEFVSAHRLPVFPRYGPHKTNMRPPMRGCSGPSTRIWASQARDSGDRGCSSDTDTSLVTPISVIFFPEKVFFGSCPRKTARFLFLVSRRGVMGNSV